MKIGIIIPLKSKLVSKDWNITCQNAEATVSSVLRQKDKSFEAVLVGHEKPDFVNKLTTEKKFNFLQLSDFAPPNVEECNLNERQIKYEMDRCTKILKGIKSLKEKHPDISYWFALDADDLIHQNFVGILKKYSSADAIILDRGYFYYKNTGITNLENEFSAYCGSSAILSNELFQLPEVITENSFRLIPFGQFSHVHMKDRLSEKGCIIAVPEERIVIYVRNNGENISNSLSIKTPYRLLKWYVKMFVRAKKLDRSVKLNFGLR